MMKSIIEKLFCKHEWRTHDKKMKVETFHQQDIIGKYVDTGVRKEFTIEILICIKCGKITKLKY